MKTKPRTEWNGLPGLLAAERMIGTSNRDDFNRLDLGFDAKTVEEFLAQPLEAIARKMQHSDVATRSKGEDDLNELVIRFGKVIVMAERERVAEEERMKRGR